MSKSPDVGQGSGLFYYGTQDEVRVGDQVKIKRWLRKDLEGTVCHIPGVGVVDPDLEDPESGIREWAILLSDGTMLQTIYEPKLLQPKKHLMLVARSLEATVLSERSPWTKSS